MPEAVHYAVLQAFKARAEGLSLEALKSVEVVWDLTEKQLGGWSFPLLLISPLGNEEDLGGTNLRDDIGYPVSTLFLDRAPVEDPRNMARALLWRETLRHAFINQRLDDVGNVVASVNTVRYRSGPVEVTLPSGYQVLTHPLNFVAVSREARG